MKISEIQIIPVKPKDGLVAFTSFLLNDVMYMGSIAILTRPSGGYRLVYPTRKVGDKQLNIFYPIKKEFAQMIEDVVIKKYEEVTENYEM